MKSKISIPHNLLIRFPQRQKLFAKFAYIKSLYPRGIVYSYSVNSVFHEGRTNLSKNTIRKYFKEFFDNDLVYIKEGNLIFRSKKELANKQNPFMYRFAKKDPRKKIKKYVKNPTYFKMEAGSIKELELQLNCEYVLTKYNQVVYSKKAKQDTVSQQNTAEMPITIASGQLGKYLGKSNSSAQRILKKANYKYLVAFKHAKKKICRIVSKEHFDGLKKVQNGLFAYRGYAWQKLPNDYLPLTIYNLTYNSQ